jgi:hypothetical protein
MGRMDMPPQEHTSPPSHSGVMYDVRVDIAYLLLGLFLLPLLLILTPWVGQWILFPGMAVLTVVQWLSGLIPHSPDSPPSGLPLPDVLAWLVAVGLSAFVWSAVLVVPVAFYAGRFPCLLEPRGSSGGVSP